MALIRQVPVPALVRDKETYPKVLTQKRDSHLCPTHYRGIVTHESRFWFTLQFLLGANKVAQKDSNQNNNGQLDESGIVSIFQGERDHHILGDEKVQTQGNVDHQGVA